MKAKVRKAARFGDSLKKKLRRKGKRRAYEKGRKSALLAYKIFTLREKLGMTQMGLARRIGVSQQAVSRLESGKFERFTLRTLERLARAMGVELVLDLRKRKVHAG